MITKLLWVSLIMTFVVFIGALISLGSTEEEWKVKVPVTIVLFILAYFLFSGLVINLWAVAHRF